MDVLATRLLQYRYDDGSNGDVALTIFAPSRTQHDWQCGFQFSPPINQKILHVYGIDFIQAIVGCLKVARGYIEHPTEDRSSWQGMSHSGLPWHAERPASYHPPDLPPAEDASPDLQVLATRKLGYPGASGIMDTLLLIVYKPLESDDGAWECAFALGPGNHTHVRHGRGADFLEAFLNALALARAAYERLVPGGWVAPKAETFLDTRDLPYNIGRAYWTEPATNISHDCPSAGDQR